MCAAGSAAETCSVDAVLRPEPALMTSIITDGSSPALTPIATASEVAAMAVAERKLLASFMVCAMPGLWPMTKTLPKTESASLTSVDVGLRAGHHDGERALVRAADAARHRMIDLHDVVLGKRRRDLRRHARAGGGEVDETLDALAVDDAALADRDFFARSAATAGSPSRSRPGRRRPAAKTPLWRRARPAAPPRRCACRRRRACGRPRSAAAPSARPCCPAR